MSRIYTLSKSFLKIFSFSWPDTEIIEYQEILSSAFYSEKKLENSIQVYLNRLLPEYHCIPFKLNIYDPKNKRTKKADLALIRKDLKEWYVVEVELEGHPLLDVKKQVESFFEGVYNEKHAKYIVKKSKVHFDKNELIKMFNTVPVKLLVIVDEIREKWEKELANFNCKVCEFQIYNDRDGSQAYRLRGPYPTTYTDFCSCKIELFGYLELYGRVGREFCDTVNINNGDTISISFLNRVSRWKRVDDSDKIYLEPIGVFTLQMTKTQYVLTYNKTTGTFKLI